MSKICPRCKKEYSGYPAISRRDNRTEICSDCGIAEALEEYVNHLDKETEVMTAETLVKEFENRGYNVEVRTITKNGRDRDAIVIHSEQLQPCLYVDEAIRKASDRGMSEADVVDDFERMMDERPDVDINLLEDRDYILSHVYVCLQRESSEDIIKGKWKYDGIESYYRIFIGDGVSTKVKKEILSVAGVSEEEVSASAYNNTIAHSECKTMAQKMSELMGIPYDESEDMKDMWCMTNDTGVYGSSALIDNRALESIALKTGVSELFIIPSSIHEVLVIPNTRGYNLDDMSKMVREVNASEVADEDILGDGAFVIKM